MHDHLISFINSQTHAYIYIYTYIHIYTVRMHHIWIMYWSYIIHILITPLIIYWRYTNIYIYIFTYVIYIYICIHTYTGMIPYGIATAKRPRQGLQRRGDPLGRHPFDAQDSPWPSKSGLHWLLASGPCVLPGRGLPFLIGPELVGTTVDAGNSGDSEGRGNSYGFSFEGKKHGMGVLFFKPRINGTKLTLTWYPSWWQTSLRFRCPAVVSVVTTTVLRSTRRFTALVRTWRSTLACCHAGMLAYDVGIGAIGMGAMVSGSHSKAFFVQIRKLKFSAWSPCAGPRLDLGSRGEFCFQVFLYMTFFHRRKIL